MNVDMVNKPLKSIYAIQITTWMTYDLLVFNSNISRLFVWLIHEVSLSRSYITFDTIATIKFTRVCICEFVFLMVEFPFTMSQNEYKIVDKKKVSSKAFKCELLFQHCVATINVGKKIPKRNTNRKCWKLSKIKSTK